MLRECVWGGMGIAFSFLKSSFLIYLFSSSFETNEGSNGSKDRPFKDFW